MWVSASLSLCGVSDGEMISVDTAAGAVVVTLPPTSSVQNGYSLTLRMLNGPHFATIEGFGAEVIDAQNFFKLTLPGQTATLRCEGSQWNVVAEAGTVSTVQVVNGGYRKYADGRLEVWGSGSGAAVAIPYYGQFVGDETFVYPHAFCTPPTEKTHSIQSPGRTSNPRGGALDQCAARHFSISSDQTVISGMFNARGRWF